jgi:hypothetical protein
MPKLKIAYFELFHAQFYEDYSINPSKYGGGPIFARWAKEFWKDKYDFRIFAPKQCFEHIDESKENKKCFIEFHESYGQDLINGRNIKEIIPNIDYFDIILHGHTCVAINNINCRPVQVHWSGFGRASDGHPFIPYTLVYGTDTSPYYRNQKTFPIKIGKPVPKIFKENKKEDFLFQCSRHDSTIDTIQIAKECIKYNKKGIFAGPINGDYRLMDYIDSKNTFYIPKISESDKIEYYKKAQLSSLICPLGLVFNQSVVECLAHGTPIIRLEISHSGNPTFRDFMSTIVFDGYNGMIFNGNNFLECWEQSKNIKQINCWESAKQYSVEAMIESFEKAIDFVVEDAKIFG